MSEHKYGDGSTSGKTLRQIIASALADGLDPVAKMYGGMRFWSSPARSRFRSRGAVNPPGTKLARQAGKCRLGLRSRGY